MTLLEQKQHLFTGLILVSAYLYLISDYAN